MPYLQKFRLIYVNPKTSTEMFDILCDGRLYVDLTVLLRIVASRVFKSFCSMRHMNFKDIGASEVFKRQTTYLQARYFIWCLLNEYWAMLLYLNHKFTVQMQKRRNVFIHILDFDAERILSLQHIRHRIRKKLYVK